MIMFTFPSKKEKRRWLQVAVQQGSPFYPLHFRALPCGLTSAARVFTKIVVALVAALRLQGIFIIPYLNNWFLNAASWEIHIESLLGQGKYKRLSVRHAQCTVLLSKQTIIGICWWENRIFWEASHPISKPDKTHHTAGAHILHHRTEGLWSSSDMGRSS